MTEFGFGRIARVVSVTPPPEISMILFLRSAIACLALLSPGFALPHSALAEEAHEHIASSGSVMLGPLLIEGAFARATLPGAPVGGGYLTITNSGAEADRLLEVSSDVSAAVQLHQMTVVDGMMKMEHLPEGIEIPAGGAVKLAPGGMHIMFMGLKEGFVEGAVVPVAMTFEKAGTVGLDLKVEGVSASEASGHAH